MLYFYGYGGLVFYLGVGMMVGGFFVYIVFMY